MEPKKNAKYDLERKSPLFFFIGLIVALLCVTAAFEWRMEYDPIDITTEDRVWEEPPVILSTRHVEPEPPKPIAKKEEIRKVEKATTAVEVVEVIDEIPVETLQPKIDADPLAGFNVEEGIKEEEPKTFEGKVETMPSFPGGDKAFLKYISENVEFTRQAKAIGVSGTVFVQFVIDVDGSLTEVKVLKGVGAGLDEEVIRVVENAPKWSPGKQRGRAVKFRMVLPVRFHLE